MINLKFESLCEYFDQNARAFTLSLDPVEPEFGYALHAQQAVAVEKVYFRNINGHRLPSIFLVAQLPFGQCGLYANPICLVRLGVIQGEEYWF